eukprot:CAMPEP_0203705382 /NCGR_PEP_ID=MMETSP0091-20130426/49685_1 /ASSEMBLY_ACC=CAM_ASM_001089 /TAXON_ID=426623 /ORGANISM="Chaetoceros affinis, Strain CCMP159" /LENGTH=96 /DNA_ID=CAMNT_0050580775 /DNA_START=290 /DNA_END=577 /DNA_ORIENTATION=-
MTLFEAKTYKLDPRQLTKNETCPMRFGNAPLIPSASPPKDSPVAVPEPPSTIMEHPKNAIKIPITLFILKGSQPSNIHTAAVIIGWDGCHTLAATA